MSAGELKPVKEKGIVKVIILFALFLVTCYDNYQNPITGTPYIRRAKCNIVAGNQIKLSSIMLKPAFGGIPSHNMR